MLAQITTTAVTIQSHKQINLFNIAAWLIIIVGIFLRLYHYFYNRSLWEDELSLAIGIVKMSFGELAFKPLPYFQKAPVGYLFISHCLVLIIGKQEMALRLYALLTGISSLFLFIPVARYFLEPLGATLALALLALAPPLVYHAVEAKPYGTELFSTILILWLYIRYQYKTNSKALLAWGLWGAALSWFTYSSIFVLIGVALTVSLGYLLKGNWRALLQLTVPFSMWALSFIASYLLFAKEGSTSGWLIDFHANHAAYMPVKPISGATWLVKQLFSFLHYPLGLSWNNDWMEHTIVERLLQRMAILPLILSAIGIIYFHKRNRKYLLLTSSVLLVALLASALKAYPFHERLTVYLAPFAIILLAGGCDYFTSKPSPVRTLGYILALMLLFGPLKNSLNQINRPYLFGDYKKSYHREALQYLNSHFQPGDEVYIYWNELPGYELYKNIYPLKFNGVLGKDYRHTTTSYKEYFKKIDADLNALPNRKRVWIVWSNIDYKLGDYMGDPAWYYGGVDFKNSYGIKRFQAHLLQIGKVSHTYVPTDGNTFNDIHVSLVDLR